MLRLAQYHFAVMRAERERAKKIAIEAAQSGAELAIVERNLGLLDRGREHDVEADHLGAAGNDCGQHARDFRCPGYRRRTRGRGVR